MEVIVWGTDTCPKCRQLEANLRDLGCEVEHADAASANGFIYLSKKKCRPTKVPILEAEGKLFRYDQLFNERDFLMVDSLKMIILKELNKPKEMIGLTYSRYSIHYFLSALGI